jgi:hypothetical protein
MQSFEDITLPWLQAVAVRAVFLLAFSAHFLCVGIVAAKVGLPAVIGRNRLI